MKKAIVLCFLLADFWLPAFSQSDDFQSIVLDTRKQLVYDHHLNSQVTHVLTGKRYPFANTGSRSHKFFVRNRPISGSLVFDGVLFKDILIEYDLYDQLVVVLLRSKNNMQYVSVDTDKITRFSIGAHDFVSVQGDSIMQNGFHRIPYSGTHSSVLVRHRKDRVERSSADGYSVKFSLKSAFFVKNQYGTFQITGKRSFLTAYQNSKELIAIIKQRKIKFSKKRIEKGLITAVSLMDSSDAGSLVL